MTTITVFQSADGIYKRVLCEGHAGFAQAGADIVCAAVSILVLNTVNSIEKFGGQKFLCSVEEEKGTVCLEMTEDPTKETKLLLDSMLLGLNGIREQYGKQYVKLEFKEV